MPWLKLKKFIVKQNCISILVESNPNKLYNRKRVAVQEKIAGIKIS